MTLISLVQLYVAVCLSPVPRVPYGTPAFHKLSEDEAEIVLLQHDIDQVKQRVECRAASEKLKEAAKEESKKERAGGEK